ncbi:MAG: type I-C CRISPR-associated protein Cas5c [Oscillospiraceae bacterium]|jgi:CRISPR-associated protein Cas5d|nr:type I-C CRISPR-associated protein Cas5c [Oscillospiraceae bacterium]
MDHKNSVEFQVHGRYALFSDPITRVGGEKCTYQIPTYQAIKGILESVYWKPTFVWVIDKMRIMNPIRTQSKGIRPIKMNGGNDLSIYTYLSDVRYQVMAHFEWNENRPELAHDRNENKHWDIAKRSIERGGRRDIFLGTRECQGYVEPDTFGDGDGAYDTLDELAFGVMLHSISYPDESKAGTLETLLWQPAMRRGVVEFVRPCECKIRRELDTREYKVFTVGQNLRSVDDEAVDVL